MDPIEPDDLPLDVPPEDDGQPPPAADAGSGGSGLEAAANVGSGALDVGSGLADLGGCLDGCGGCSLVLFVLMFLAAGSAMALLR
jgi:hypothetical protein